MKSILSKLRQNNNLNDLNSLYKTPERENKDDSPHVQVFKENLIQQADLLYLPEDNLSNDKIKYFWQSVKEEKVKPEERKLYSNIFRSFLDTDDKIIYIITDIVKPSKISKQKKGLYYKYYDKNKYGLVSPTDENDFEYTEVNIFVNSKWVKWKNRIKGIQIKPEIDNSGYKYCLVVVDNHNKKCDAVPLKERTSEAILKGFKELYSHGILKKPKLQLEVDPGKEFNELEHDDYFKGVHIRRGLTNRHRQQSLVEFKNQIIGKLIHQLQAIDELETGKINTSWVEELPLIIKEINEIYVKPVNTQLYDGVFISNKNKVILPEGTRVRRQLDYPIDAATNKRIYSKFRASDIRWSKEIYKIKEILLKPGFPPMYLLDNNDNVPRTKQQLQILDLQFV
jgi:hypothetical protein